MTVVVPGRSSSVDVGTELLRARARQLAKDSRAAKHLTGLRIRHGRFPDLVRQTVATTRGAAGRNHDGGAVRRRANRCSESFHDPSSVKRHQRGAPAGRLRVADDRCRGPSGLERHPTNPGHRADEKTRRPHQNDCGPGRATGHQPRRRARPCPVADGLRWRATPLGARRPRRRRRHPRTATA